MNDVTEGVSGLIYEGSVKTLVKNVTHGISNSAAKVTESLSDGLGRVIMDERHEEARQRIRANTTGSSDHLVAGLKGFGFGLLGGVTSIFKQTYDGAANEGFPVCNIIDRNHLTISLKLTDNFHGNSFRYKYYLVCV